MTRVNLLGGVWAVNRELWEDEFLPGRCIKARQQKALYYRRKSHSQGGYKSPAGQVTSGQNYSKSMESVFKVLSYGKSQKSVLNQSLYVARARGQDNLKNSLLLENDLGVELKGQDKIKEELKSWDLIADHENRSKKWIESSFEERGDIKIEDAFYKRQSAHMMFSVPEQSMPANVVKEKLRTAIRIATRETFGDAGHRYVFTLHDDHSKRIHAHILVKTKNEYTGKQLRLGREDLMVIRDVFTRKSIEQGIKIEASQRLDRPELRQKIRDGQAPLRHNKTANQLRIQSKQGKTFMAKTPAWYQENGLDYEQRRAGVKNNPSLVDRLKKVIGLEKEKPLVPLQPIHKAEQGINAREQAAINRLNHHIQTVYKQPTEARESILKMMAENPKLAVWAVNNHPVAFGEITGEKPEKNFTGRDLSRFIPSKPEVTHDLPIKIQKQQAIADEKVSRNKTASEQKKLEQLTMQIDRKIEQLPKPIIVDTKGIKGQFLNIKQAQLQKDQIQLQDSLHQNKVIEQPHRKPVEIDRGIER
jgi:hypothetical protein